ncbi:MAG: restriction endonuclease subunit S [Verrucomicrobiota bacterium]
MKPHEIKLSECVDLLSGFAFKSKNFTTNLEDIALVKGENVSQGRVLWDISKRWVREDWSQFKKFQLKPGDVVIAMDRPWVPAGLKWCFIRDHDPMALLVQRCCRLRANPLIMDQTFLRCLIGGPGFEGYIKPITTGVNIPHISGRQILDYSFNLSPLPEQKRIARILSAYDDLIENNLRRIKILEEMAQSLYREWFVHFRFPGHESTPMIDSPLGPIPEGWEVKKLGEIYDTSSGGTPSRKKPEYYEKGDIEWVKTKELKDGFVLESEEKINSFGLSKSSAKLFPANTVLIALYGATIGQLGILSQPAATNQACCALLQKDELYGRAFAFYTLLNARTDLINLRQGAAQQNISQALLKKFEIICPPENLIRKFNFSAETILDNIYNLQHRNQNLRATRDLLLPKLITPTNA